MSILTPTTCDLSAVIKSSATKDGRLVSRNVTVGGHRTSVRLEPRMWDGLREICYRERMTLHEVCTVVAEHKSPDASLTAAIRVFVMTYFRSAATEEGHLKVGHGPGGPFAPRQHFPLNAPPPKPRQQAGSTGESNQMPPPSSFSGYSHVGLNG